MSHFCFSQIELEKSVAGKTKLSKATSISGSLLISEFGGRILGLFPEKNLPNTLWIAKDPASKVAKNDWSIGGDRLWLAPEKDFYYTEPNTFNGFHVQSELDPGHFKEVGNLDFESQFNLKDYSRNKTYSQCIFRRRFRLIDDPYQTGLAYAGLEIREKIQLTGTDRPMCAWSITQVYTCGKENPGTALFPVKKGAAFLSYFNPIPASRAEVLDGYARFKIDAVDIFKFAIKPEDVISENQCKTLYVSPYPDGKNWFCIAKRTDDLPESQSGCVDFPKSDPNGIRGVTQSYNNGTGFSEEEMPFGEIELQFKKGISTPEGSVSQATHQVLSYAGSKKKILELAQKLLKIDSLPKIY